MTTTTTTLADSSGSTPASLVAVTALVAHVAGADALEVRAGVDHLDLGDDVLGTISVDLLVADAVAAERLATHLHLTECLGPHATRERSVSWRCWHGWLAAGGWDLPVSLHVAALGR